MAAVTSAFANLSEDAQSIVGQEAFNAVPGNELYDSLSDADKAIVDGVGQ